MSREIDLAAKYNARLATEGKRGMMWIYDKAGQLKLVSTRDWSPPGSQLVPPR